MRVLGFSGLDRSVAFKQQEFPRLPDRFYRLVQGLDAAAALVDDHGVMAAAAEERFTGCKGTGAFPANAIGFCLERAGLHHSEIDVVAHSFCYEPYEQFYQELGAFGRRQFAQVYSRDAQLRLLAETFPGVDWDAKLRRVPHHVAHAASSFYLSGFPEALILVVDAMGEAQSTTVALGGRDGIQIVKEVPALHSLGLLYGTFTLYLGFSMASDEYKVMGLAPYGDPRRYFRQLMDLVQLRDDGTYAIPALYANSSLEEKESYSRTLGIYRDLFGPSREPSAPITQHHSDLAAALQNVLHACLLHLLRHYQAETGQENLCMAGGVALNCTANSVIRRSRIFRRMFVQPAAGDDGSALGAALYVSRSDAKAWTPTSMRLPTWGPGYDDETIGRVLARQSGCEVVRFEGFDALTTEVVELLASGRVIAWFQGAMEFGPRALGNRSILADPRRADMRAHLNAIIKKREEFRPFAPAVTAEHARAYFDIEDWDEEHLYTHMLFVAPVRSEHRDSLPAVTHVDGSARLQVVFRDQNPRFWQLLRRFGQATGVPVLLNTSFNLRDQPIVCNPSQAVATLLNSELDALVIGNYLVTRTTTAAASDPSSVHARPGVRDAEPVSE
jgi:carbamoyltransferase